MSNNYQGIIFDKLENQRKFKEEKEIPSWFGKEIKKEEVDDETRRLIEEIEGTSVNSS
jgi:G:T/U-mismatch repair DNA glycosylase